MKLAGLTFTESKSRKYYVAISTNKTHEFTLKQKGDVWKVWCDFAPLCEGTKSECAAAIAKRDKELK